MAWIESHQSLKDHPKVSDLMVKMDWTLDTTIGKLHRFWWWCVDYAEDGDLRKHNEDRLGIAVGIPPGELSKKFVTIMVETHWIDKDPYLRVHNWWDYIGRFLQVKYKHQSEIWMRVRSLYKENIDIGENPLSMRMDEWSRQIKARDNNICQKCGKTEHTMYAHHIKKQSDFPSLIYDLSNGITLCCYCHEDIQGKENKYEKEFIEKVSQKCPESIPKVDIPNQPDQPNQPDVVGFFDYFCLKTKKKFKLTPANAELIKNRFKEGYTIEQLKKTVDNFIQDDFPERYKYLDLLYCIGKQRGKPDNLEKWLNYKPQLKAVKP